MVYAGDFEKDQAIESLLKLLSYRNDPKWWNITAKARNVLVCKLQIIIQSNGVIYTFGRDRQFRPIVIINAYKIVNRGSQVKYLLKISV